MDCVFETVNDLTMTDSMLVTPPTMALHPLRPVFKALQFEISNCLSEALAPSTPVIELFAQKNEMNSGRQEATLMTMAQIEASIGYSEPSLSFKRCKITSWFITEVGGSAPISKEHALYKMTFQDLRSQPSLGDLRMSTHSNSIPDEVFEFQLRFQLSPDQLLHAVSPTMRLYFGCFKVTSLKVVPNTQLVYPSLIQASPDAFKFVFSKANQPQQLSLLDFLDFKTEYPSCGALRLTSFTDSSLRSPTVSSSFGLQTNPTIKDQNHQWQPVVLLN